MAVGATETQEPVAAEESVGEVSHPVRWLGLSGAALTATVLHMIVDAHIGIGGGPSVVMSSVEATSAVLHALILGGWMVAVAFAARGNRTGTASALVFTVLWAVFVNGIVAFLVAPPPSAAFPYQDIAHAGSLLFGGLAAYSLWQEFKRQDGTIRLGVPLLAFGLVVATLAAWAIEYAAYY